MNLKKIKPSYFLYFFLLWANFCISNEMNNQLPEPDRIAHNIIDETIDILTKKHPIKPCGIGMNGKFEYLEISFQVSEILNKQKARAMLFDCKEIFLEKINNNEKIQPYLKSHPFTFENVGIVFYIGDEKNNDVFHPEISVARWSSNGVSFKTTDKENIYRFKEVYQETHEEALALVKKNQIAQQSKNE